MTYYSNISVPINHIGQKYYDVTSLYELRYYSLLRWELFVVHKDTGKTVVSLIYSEKKSQHKQADDRLFLSYSMKTSQIKVLVREDQLNEEELVVANKYEYLSFSPGCFFFGCPRNTLGSLILNPSIVSISEYMKRIKDTQEGDLLEQLNCEIVDNGVVEVALSPEELDQLRSSSGNEYFDNFYDMAMFDDDAS